jgi:hypothetical protein
MAATCPNKKSVQWKQVMRRANGNEDVALEIWIEEGYAENPDLNVPEVNEEAEDLKKAEEITPEDAADNLEALVDKTVLYLEKRKQALGRMKFKSQKEQRRQRNRLSKLSKNIRDAEGVKSITLFIDEAYKQSLQQKTRMKEFQSKIRSEDAERKDLIADLVVLNDYAHGYNFLDEINKQDIFDYFNTTEQESMAIFEKDEEGKSELTPQQKLKEAISIRDTIKQRVITEAIPLMADFLLDARSTFSTEALKAELASLNQQIKDIEESNRSPESKEKLIATKKAQITFIGTKAENKEQMIKMLQQAAVDEGVFDYLIGPLISSPDSAIALFAKAVKDQFELARLDDIEAKRIVTKAFKSYLSVAPAGRDNPKEFNNGLFEIQKKPVYEKVQYEGSNKVYTKKKRDENGEIIYREEVHFVSKYDYKKYGEASAEWHAANPEPYSDIPKGKLTPIQRNEVKLWRAKRKKELYGKIRKLKSVEEIAAIDARAKKERNAGIMDAEQYAEWKTYKRFEEITEPSDEFISEKWLAMYNMDGTAKNEMGRYHKTLTDMYYAAQEKIPETQRPGTRIPSINKKDLERFLDEGAINLMKTKVKEGVYMQSYDIESEIQGIDGTAVSFLPIYFTQEIGIDDVSYDLASSVLLFNQMANRYDAMNEIQGEVSFMKQIIGQREVPKFNKTTGEKVYDSFAAKLGYENYIRANGTSWSKLHLDAFIDMVVYGEMQKKEEILGSSISWQKLSNTITGVSAITTIAADLLKGVANGLQGNIQLVIEAAGAEFFSLNDYRKGTAQYAKHLAGMLGDFGEPTPTSFMGRLGELYDPMQGDFRDKYGRKVTMSTLNKLIRTDTLFFNQYFGEHEIQYAGMLAILNSVKVRDKKTGNEISLYEAYEKYELKDAHKNIEWITTNKDGVKTYQPFTEKERRSVQDRIHGLSKKMHGIYNNFDKGTIQRYGLGRLAMMYRKHMYPGFKRRWKQYSWDEEIGAASEGHYRTFGRALTKDLRTYQFDLAKQWASYTPGQKANIKRSLAEFTIIFSLMGLIAVLAMAAGDDDEIEESYAYNFMMYEMIRMRSETFQYLNPIDVYRTVRSPSAALTTAEKMIRFIGQIMPWNITEEYKRKSGKFEKGDNKAWAYFLKLIGLPGYNMNPREAVKVYESLINI